MIVLRNAAQEYEEDNMQPVTALKPQRKKPFVGQQ
jgi:hypothetical protein